MVEFASSQSLTYVAEHMDKLNMLDKRRLRFHVDHEEESKRIFSLWYSRPQPQSLYRLFVVNLSDKTSSRNLQNHLDFAGVITEAKAHFPYKGEGIVE